MKQKINEKQNVYKRVVKYLPLYILSIIFLILSQYLSSLNSIFIGQALSIFSGEENIILPSFLSRFFNTTSMLTKLESLSLIFISVGVAMIFLRLIRTLMRRCYTLSVECDTSLTFFTHAIKLPKKYMAQHSTGDIIQRNIQDSQKFTDFVGDSIYNLLYALSTIGVILFNMFYLSKTNFLITLAVVLVVVGFELIYAIFVIRKKEEILSRMLSDMNSVTQQSYSNIMMIKTFTGENAEFEKLKKQNNKVKDAQYEVDLLYAKYWTVMDIFTVVYNALMMIVIGYLFISGKIGLGVSTSLIMFNSEILDSASTLIDRINKLIRNSVAGGRLNEYLRVDDDFSENGTEKPEINGKIEIKNLCMKYDGEDRLVLNDISLDIEPGEVVGVVGKSGSGKTTLLNVLSRLDEYTSGSIKIDGVELKDIEKKYLRENLSFVSQDCFVFSTTIKNNLTMLTNNEKSLVDYSKRVCLDEDIKDFPNGYETLVGERGVTLSGGQKQRISIARALMKEKNIILLDDCLSAIDNKVSAKIRKTIAENNSTTLIVSHNLLNVMNADKIIVLDAGKIVQMGKHEELVSQKGIYQDIWILQQNMKGSENE